ncbi:MAG TPA: hypothetical protein VLS53_07355 [Candidatus Dormibacteraeota bacterium]|nr:hypothetical protein [Candidatus Dormibacteraeota bacterium]
MSTPPVETTKTPGSPPAPQDAAPATLRDRPSAPPADPFAYRIAVGALGAALVAFLIGAAVIAAGGKPVPTQYWSTGSGIAGAIIGILAPSPTPAAPTPRQTKVRLFFGTIADAFADLWANRTMLLLAIVFATSLTFAIVHNSAPLETVAATAGGALVGLLAPPPGNQAQK